MSRHKSRAHAILSASGAHRWMTCTPSARLAENVPSTSSVYAREGTLAHEFLEVELYRRMLRDVDRFLPEYSLRETAKRISRTLTKLRKHELYKDEMEDHARDFADIIFARVGPQDRLYPERRVHFDRWVPQGFGTVDVTIVRPKLRRIEIMDYKYGSGVRVQAAGNEQLRLYGLGALEAFHWYNDIDRIAISVYQPRMEPTELVTEELTTEELYAWGDEVVAPTAKAAWEGDGELVAGDHCRFCPVKGTCKAFAEAATAQAREYFDPVPDPELLPPDQFSLADLAIIYERLPLFKSWIKAVDEHIYTEATNGNVLPGYKLVRNNGRRKWSSEDAVAAKLQELGFDEVQYTKKKLIGLGDAAKLIGDATEFDNELGALIVRSEASPSLVPDTDPRPSMNESAKDYFDVES